MSRVLPIALIASALLLGGCTFVIHAPVVCPEGTVLKDGRWCQGQVVGGGAAAQTGAVGGDPGAMLKRLSSFEDAGSSSWDLQVEALLLESFDRNDSQSIDTTDEVAAISCEVWREMDGAVRGSNADSVVPLLALYGFAPGYLWAGGAIGFAEEMRLEAFNAMERCGLNTE